MKQEANVIDLLREVIRRIDKIEARIGGVVEPAAEAQNHDKPPHGVAAHIWPHMLQTGWGGYVLDRTSKVTQYGGDALDKFLKDYSFNEVLDLGCGSGTHAKYMREMGKQVVALDIRPHPQGFQPDIVGDYLKLELPKQYEAIWCSHVLEHMPNINIFLKKVFSDLKDGGPLAITVPPMRHSIVDGHVSNWNAGLLLYNLVIAGFDCSKAAVRTYGYNVSVIVEKKGHGLSEWTELAELQPYFPLPAKQYFDGRIKSLNW